MKQKEEERRREHTQANGVEWDDEHDNRPGEIEERPRKRLGKKGRGAAQRVQRRVAREWRLTTAESIAERGAVHHKGNSRTNRTVQYLSSPVLSFSQSLDNSIHLKQRQLHDEVAKLHLEGWESVSVRSTIAQMKLRCVPRPARNGPRPALPRQSKPSWSKLARLLVDEERRLQNHARKKAIVQTDRFLEFTVAAATQSPTACGTILYGSLTAQSLS